MRENREIVLRAVQQNGNALKYSSLKYLVDSEIVSTAIVNGVSLDYLKNKLILHKNLIGNQNVIANNAPAMPC